MRVLYIASAGIPTEKAYGIAIMRQCEAFVHEGATLTLIKPYRRRAVGDPFSFYGIQPQFTLKTLPTVDWRRDSWYGTLLTRVIDMCVSFVYIVRHQNQFDIVYARDHYSLLLPLVFCRSCVRACELHTKHTGFFTRFILKRIAYLFVISEGLKTHYANITKRDDILVEPSGVDIDQFGNLPEVEKTRTMLSVPQNMCVFGYIGRYTTMGEEKGVTGIMEAFAHLHKSNRSTHLLLVGLEEREIEVVHAHFKKLGLERTSYTLSRLDPKKFGLYLHACDVLVMNYPNTEHYRSYMSPSKLFAYMASGKIVITSDLPTVREVVDESRVCFASPDDTDDLYRVMGNVYTNLSKYAALGARAKECVGMYSWRSRAQRVLSVINRSSR